MDCFLLIGAQRRLKWLCLLQSWDLQGTRLVPTVNWTATNHPQHPQAARLCPKDLLYLHALPIHTSVSSPTLLNLPFKSLLMWQRPKIDHYIWTQIIFIYLSNGMNSRDSCSSYMCPSHTQPSCSSTSHHAHRLGLTHFIFAQTVLPTTLPSPSVCNIQVYIRPLTAQTSQVRGYLTAQE